MDFETSFEKNVRKNLDSIFGERSPDIKEITRLELIEAGKDEKEKVLNLIRYKNLKDLDLIKENEYLTYDNNGKIIPFQWSPLKSQQKYYKIDLEKEYKE